mmetsp:Transcript_14623/g.22584  ORF Transcript_14623/g.22584 Transcript_14623/m.22584 type:complete len:392 (+) Transcript_14623:361-1536(+)|eukprot:CAMPEP_0196813590 /NCGR_PEP_ID=MMETSP1362-20130617/37779_1 /TAXON_ID=163516 /ORGANISM="Leptocylindrus danicus, Strain CCMP1856" /LENGTH=391 /DNA_ID=CAMNT_0042189899 /DNA_START=333 /DNA_END=1508 /DNA_ORIENTATION=+
MGATENEIKTESSATSYCTTFENVQEAAMRIRNIAHRTPVLTCSTMDEIVSSSHERNVKIFFKVEAMQKTGSFKFRGALNAVKSLVNESKEKQESAKNEIVSLQVVTHSSGNHAQALALAAKLASVESSSCNVHATIVMPKNAPEIKKRAVEGYGAEIILVENTNEAREEKADAVVAERGASFIHPSEDPRVIAGQGTVCLEMVEQCTQIMHTSNAADNTSNKNSSPLDIVVIPVGGGGLASGNIIALRGLLGDSVKIILAEPQELNDAKRSFYGKSLVGHDPNKPLTSVADGLKTTLGPNTWPIVRDLADDVLTVSEAAILRATKFVWERLKVCIEPSAGVGVAVVMGEEFQNKYVIGNNGDIEVLKIGIVLCGGNVDIVKVAKMMEAVA